MVSFILNSQEIQTDQPVGMVLLDFIRYHKHLTGTKIGCREGDCGACTVLVGDIIDGQLRYRSMTSCLLPIGSAQGKHIVTIEGVNMEVLNPAQQAMANEGGTQCGFCTPGFVMSLAGFCLKNSIENPHTEVIAAIDGNICRCTGYKSIERAAFQVADLIGKRIEVDAAVYAAQKGLLPVYFSTIRERLQKIKSGLNKEVISTEYEVVVTGGGTDLYVQRHDSMTHAAIRFVSDDEKLMHIRLEGNRCYVGASVTVTDLCESVVFKKAFPGFMKYAALVSSTPIRNMATIAGNFVNASPIGDFTAFFLALDSTVRLSNGKTERELPLNQFYKGYKSLDKHPDEIITEIYFTLPDQHSKFNFEKVSKRTNLDIASVNSAMHLKIKDDIITHSAISAGGVGPIPTYLFKSSSFLVNKKITEDTITELLQIIQTEISPISDARGTEAYKRLLLNQLVLGHFLVMFPGRTEWINGLID